MRRKRKESYCCQGSDDLKREEVCESMTRLLVNLDTLKRGSGPHSEVVNDCGKIEVENMKSKIRLS